MLKCNSKRVIKLTACALLDSLTWFNVLLQVMLGISTYPQCFSFLNWKSVKKNEIDHKTRDMTDFSPKKNPVSDGVCLFPGEVITLIPASCSALQEVTSGYLQGDTGSGQIHPSLSFTSLLRKRVWKQH